VLAIKQALGGDVGIGRLAHRKGLLGQGLCGFPDQIGARSIAAIEGIEQIAHPGGTPDVAALHLSISGRRSSPRSIVLTSSSTVASALAMD
jgi:hypothetical protein